MRPENIAGAHEIMLELGWTHRNYIGRHKDLPVPVARINQGRTAVWDLSEIRAWKAKNRRA